MQAQAQGGGPDWGLGVRGMLVAPWLVWLWRGCVVDFLLGVVCSCLGINCCMVCVCSLLSVVGYFFSWLLFAVYLCLLWM